MANDVVLILNSVDAVNSFDPQAFDLLALPGRGLSITALSDGQNCDYVSRFFCPRFGVPEDPVTGSSHAILARYWATVLKKTHLTGHQLSRRGGVVYAKISGNEVWIGGRMRRFCHSICEIEIDF